MKLLRQLFVLLALVCLGASASLAADATTPAGSPKDLVLKGDAKCTGCHDETDDAKPSMLELHPSVLSIGKTRHGTRADGRTPTCTDCHGESEKHRAFRGSGEQPLTDIDFRKKTKTAATDRNGACLTCHDKDPKRHLWAGSVHDARDVACTSCHQVHAAKDKVLSKLTQPEVCFTCHKEQRAQVNKPSHHPILEGKVACSDCHNAHGSAGPMLMKRDSVVDTCYTCHMEKRGPFVHNHEPVNEDCSNCHNPHGTVAENLLKSRPPFLCHQCHTPHGAQVAQVKGQGQEQLLPGVPASATGNPLLSAGSGGKSGINYTQARGCLNCHTQVHGSNNPSATNPTPQFNFR